MSRKLGTLLLQAGIIDSRQLEESIDLAKKRNVSLWDVLLEEQKVSEESLADAFSNWMKLPRIRLASANIEPEAVGRITEELARKHLCVPISLEGKTLVVAFANPADFDAIQDLQFVTGCMVRPVVSSRTEINDAIDTHYKTQEQAQEFLADIADAGDLDIVEAGEEEMDLDTGGAASADLPPVVKMCNVIIRDTIKMGASDVHIEPGVNNVQIRLRIDGVLREYMQMPKWLHGAVVSRLKILGKLDIAERRVPQDGRLKVQVQGRPVDLRLSTLPTHFGEKVVMRVLGSTNIPTFEKMGYSPDQIKILDTSLNQPQGLILVTGPTGSGKSTTLYSSLKYRQSPEVNIITVEDPIEYQLPGINQVQVNAKQGLTFAAALRSILRQDPDIILVGEIRDLETAEIAFHAAMTGHMVLATLHTNGTLATIGRLLDMGIESPLISSSVALITAQRLARRICQQCKEPYAPTPGMLEKLRMDDPGAVWYHGKGCSACGNTGFAGRVGIYELLRITPSVRELINQKAPESELRKAAGLAGTRFLLEDAMEKVQAGVTTVEEVMRVIQMQEEDIIRCPQCSAYINSDFTSCPYCLYALKYLCQECRQELKLEWKICPYCNAKANHALTGESLGQKMLVGGKHAPSDAESVISVDDEPGEPKSLPAGVTRSRAAAAAAAAPAPSPAPTAAPEAAETPVTKKPRILIVDDDDGIKFIVRKALKLLPIRVEVETADDGVEALEEIERERPDLVILDVMMPRLDGFGVCEKLRADLRTAFIPVMMLTANADESSRTRGYLVGTDDYVNKPFAVPELNARVMRLLRRTYGL